MSEMSRKPRRIKYDQFERILLRDIVCCSSKHAQRNRNEDRSMTQENLHSKTPASHRTGAVSSSKIGYSGRYVDECE